MRRSRYLPVCFLVVGVACDKPGSTGQAAPVDRTIQPQATPAASPQGTAVAASSSAAGAPAPSAASSSAAGAPAPSAPVVSATGTPGPLTISPQVTLPNGTVPIHASLIGWSGETRRFGYCGAHGPALADTRCFEAESGGRPQTVDSSSRRAQAAKLVLSSRPSWRYGGQLRLAWEVEPSALLPDGPPHRAAAFVLRGGALGEAATQVLDRIVVVPNNPDVELHADAVEPSPDGSALGVVLHAFSGEWTDRYELRVWSTDDLASRTFNGLGLSQLAAGNAEKAAELFQKAVDAAATPKALYNLACALARMADPRTRAALERALTVGGEEARKKARKDRDFDAVRKEPWFSQATR